MKQNYKNIKLFEYFTKTGLSLVLAIAGFLFFSPPLHSSLAAENYGCVAKAGTSFAWYCSTHADCYDISCQESGTDWACQKLDPSLCGKPADSNTGSSLGVVGSKCGPGLAACGQGLTCDVVGVCILPPQNPLNGNVTVPTPATPAPNGSWCNNDPNLTYFNGLCLPKDSGFPTTGVAGSTSLSDFLIKAIKILLSFAGIIAVVMLVIGGYWYMAAGGNEEMSEKGKKTIINFIMGLVVIILAYTIVSVIASTLTGADKLLQ